MPRTRASEEARATPAKAVGRAPWTKAHLTSVSSSADTWRHCSTSSARSVMPRRLLGNRPRSVGS